MNSTGVNTPYISKPNGTLWATLDLCLWNKTLATTNFTFSLIPDKSST